MTTAAAVVDKWARETTANLRRVYISAAQDVAENVVVGGAYSPGTPVDTGFARAMWVATLGDGPTAPEPVPKGLKHGEHLFELSGEAATASSELGLTIGAADTGDVITLTNRTTYLPYLEDGSTTPKDPQFYSGWIAQTAANWQNIVRLANQRVGSAFR